MGGGRGREALEGRDIFTSCLGFPGGLDGKESACNAGDPGLIPGSERSPGEENGNSLQCSCLENPMDRGDWWTTVCCCTSEANTTL